MAIIVFGWVFLTIFRMAGKNVGFDQHSNDVNNKLKEWHPPPSAFPPFQTALKARHKRPDVSSSDGTAGLVTDEAVLREWDTWGKLTMLGSYQFTTNSTIHFPHADLQAYYKDRKPDFGHLKGGYPMPSVMAHIRSPDSDLALLTRKGNKFMASGVRANQDRAVIVSPFQEEGDWWLGLFDGHGEMGHVTAHDASLQFPRLLMERIHKGLYADSNVHGKIVDALRRTFADVHHTSPHLGGAGCTGISILKMENSLYISNVGDSLAFVASYDHSGSNVEILYETKPHKPDTPEEQRRIEAAGGQVIPKPFPGGTARVIIPMPNQPPGMDLALAMSRSIGDFEGDPIGVSADPTTDVLDLATIARQHNPQNVQQQPGDEDSKRYLMAVAASDGLFDKVPPLEVAQHVAKSLLPIHPVSPLPALEQLILKSSGVWLHDPYGGEYRDDISIAVHKLNI